MTNRISKLHVRIVTGMFWAHLSGVPADAVRSVLEAITPMPGQGGASGHTLALSRECQYKVESDGGIFIMAGLVPRVVARLERLGYGVAVEDRVRWETLRNANHAMRESDNETAEDRQFLDAVADTPRGLIVVRSEAEVPWLIAKLRSFLPTARVLIVARNAARADQLYRALSKLCEYSVKRMFEGVRSMPVRTYVCPQAEFAMHSGQDWNIIVFTDTESALAAKSQETLGHMFCYAQDNLQDLFTYCFVRDTEPLGPLAQLRLEAVCGGEIYRQPTPGVPLVSVTVLMARMRGCKALPHRVDLDAKRALWHNSSRNAAIADLAKVLASGRRADIKRCGLLGRLPTGGPCKSVAILVESTAHGRKLLENLPGWELRHEVPALGEAAGGRSHLPVADRCVATYVYAQRNGVAADVLICADGARDWPLSTSVFSCRAHQTDSQAVVIDVVAAGGGTTRIQHRIEGYERYGWRVEEPVDVVLGENVQREQSRGRSPRRKNPR
jgi:hypothetical protein